MFGTGGLHSAVREAIGDEFDGHDNPTPWGVVDARLSDWPHPSDHAAAGRYRPHVQAYVVRRDALPGADASGELVHDPTGALHERLGADQPGLCLVRPDGHLGLCAEPPSLEALQAHLGRILLFG